MSKKSKVIWEDLRTTAEADGKNSTEVYLYNLHIYYLIFFLFGAPNKITPILPPMNEIVHSFIFLQLP